MIFSFISNFLIYICFVLVAGMVVPRCPNDFFFLFIQGPLTNFTSIHLGVGCSKLMFSEICPLRCPLEIYSFETSFISGIFSQIIVFRISSVPLFFLLSSLSLFFKIITLYENHGGI